MSIEEIGKHLDLYLLSVKFYLCQIDNLNVFTKKNEQ